MPAQSIKQLWSDLRKDAARYAPLGGWAQNLGFWAGATYRLGHYGRSLPVPLRPPVMLPYRVLNRVCRSILHVRISPDAEIGPGLCLIHPSNVVLGPGKIGENCMIFHEVTIGTNVDDTLPEIGNNVDIYVGARVLGGVHVGDDAKIGANCVVTSSIPAGATVVPAANRLVSPEAVAAFGPRRSSKVPTPAVEA